ncbi:MAG: TatD family hydrolase [Planctomycetia bacterium]|nr:TatD family hydrolase [Planctomycetia bacterium]
MLSDAHVHCPETGSWEEICPENVSWAILNGTSPADWPTVCRLAKNGKSGQKITPFLGLHPWFSGGNWENWKETLNAFLPLATGIGEIGLDARRPGLERATQKEAFRYQLALAVREKKPVAIHSVHAWSEMVPILKEIVGNTRIPLLFHAFQGSPELVTQLLRFRAYFSFAGCLRSSNTERFVKTLRAVPGERLLLESDAATPDVAAGLAGFYREVAETLKLPLATLCAQLRENLERLFSPEATE